MDEEVEEYENYEEHYEEIRRLTRMVLDRLKNRLRRPIEGDKDGVIFKLDDLLRVEDHLNTFKKHFGSNIWKREMELRFKWTIDRVHEKSQYIYLVQIEDLPLSIQSIKSWLGLYEQEYKPERGFPNFRARVTEKGNRQGTLLDEKSPVAERIIIDLDNETLAIYDPDDRKPEL